MKFLNVEITIKLVIISIKIALEEAIQNFQILLPCVCMF